MKIWTMGCALALMIGGAGCGVGADADMYGDVAQSTQELRRLRSCGDMQQSYTDNCAQFFGGEASCSTGPSNPDYTVPITCTCDGGAETTSTCGLLQ